MVEYSFACTRCGDSKSPSHDTLCSECFAKLLQEQLEEVVSERDIWKAAAILASDKLTTTIAERDALREVADALNVALDVDPDLEDARDRLTTALAKVPQ